MGEIIELINRGLPFILSAVSILQMVLAGSLNRYAWLLLLANQVLWFAWILISSTWGLLPLTVALAIVGVRNHVKWRNGLRAGVSA